MYFNGIGNYLRSTIIHYLDVNPFESARVIIKKHPEILEMCKDIPMMAYNLNGAQLMDWRSPFDTDYTEFRQWVFIKKAFLVRIQLVELSGLMKNGKIYVFIKLLSLKII